MNWIPVHWNLIDARMELTMLLARVQQAAFGEIFSEELKSCEELAATENRERPLTEGRLLLAMNDIYKHLNRAWNGRNALTETVLRRERTNVSCWERFPTHSIFADLRQPPRRRKPTRVTWKGQINPKAIHPFCNSRCGNSRPSTIWRNSSMGSKANRGPIGQPESPTRSRRFRWTRRNSAGGCTGSTAS